MWELGKHEQGYDSGKEEGQDSGEEGKDSSKNEGKGCSEALGVWRGSGVATCMWHYPQLQFLHFYLSFSIPLQFH